jgi:T5orf172 domain
METEASENLSLRQRVISVLQSKDEPISYRDLTDALWATFPEYRQHMLSKYETEQKARTEQRIRLGILVKNYPSIFTASKSEERVLVGLTATDADVLAEDAEAENEAAAQTAAVYWYTFPAYQREGEDFPIKIGRGINPQNRITQQVTAMPEVPVVLGTYEHPEVIHLERALHCILTVRGKRKSDAPELEWFYTTPEEIRQLIQQVAGS